MSGIRAREAEGLTTLAELVRDFRKRLGPEGPLEDGYLLWCRDSGRLSVAVLRAVMSTKPNGKMHNHQSRVPKKVLVAYGDRVMAKHRAIRRLDSFDGLLAICKDAAISGIGPVTTYDVAVRIGAFLRLAPTRVYLHAGVKLGAQALGLEVKGKAWLEEEDLPHSMRRLTADECEDFLCVYRDLFPNLERRT